MSETNTNPVDAARQSVIDSMVAGGASFEATRVATPQPNLRFNTETGVVERSGPSVDAPIPEQGRVPEVEIANIQAILDALTAEYNAETDHVKREALGTRLGRAMEAAEYDISRLSALSAQRERTAVSSDAQVNERLAVQAFSNGDPARAQAMKDALLRAEADEAAQAIVNARRVAAKHRAR